MIEMHLFCALYPLGAPSTLGSGQKRPSQDRFCTAFWAILKQEIRFSCGHLRFPQPKCPCLEAWCS